MKAAFGEVYSPLQPSAGEAAAPAACRSRFAGAEGRKAISPLHRAGAVASANPGAKLGGPDDEQNAALDVGLVSAEPPRQA